LPINTGQATSKRLPEATIWAGVARSGISVTNDGVRFGIESYPGLAARLSRSPAKMFAATSQPLALRLIRSTLASLRLDDQA